ncbi:MAG: D-2-hydroxyacid dehydrogenase, partial [Sphingobacteriales bacterium]
TSRGALINEPDLAEALNEGKLAGAGLDVLTVEPPSEGHPLFSARNCLITPHLAWATQESRQRLLHETAENIRAFFAGKPRNVVN